MGTFAAICEDIQAAHRTVAGVKTGLEDFREQLGYRREDLPQLWAQIETAKQQAQRQQQALEARRLRSEAQRLQQAGPCFLPAATRNLRQALQLALEAGEERLAAQLREEARLLREEHLLPLLLDLVLLRRPEAEQDWLLALTASASGANASGEKTANPSASDSTASAPLLAESLVTADAALLGLLWERLPTELERLVASHWRQLGQALLGLPPVMPAAVDWLELTALPLGRAERLEFAASLPVLLPQLRSLFGQLGLIHAALLFLLGNSKEGPLRADAKEGEGDVGERAGVIVVGCVRRVLETLCSDTAQVGVALSPTEALRQAASKHAQATRSPPLFLPTPLKALPEGIPPLSSSSSLLPRREQVEGEEAFTRKCPLAPSPFYALVAATSLGPLCATLPALDDPLLAGWLREQVWPRLEGSLLGRLSAAFAAGGGHEQRPCSAFLHDYGWLLRLHSHLPPSSGQPPLTDLIRLLATQFVERLQRRLGEINAIAKQPSPEVSANAAPLSPASVTSVASSVASATVGSSSPACAFSARLASEPEIRACLAKHSTQVQLADLEYDLCLAEKEALLIDQVKRDRSLPRRELLLDRRAWQTLATLLADLELLHTQLKELSSPPSQLSEFHNLLCQSVGTLASSLLYQLRLEVRCHAIYYLDLAYREGSYRLDESVDEPDGYVACLANDLVNYEALIAETLPYARYQ